MRIGWEAPGPERLRREEVEWQRQEEGGGCDQRRFRGECSRGMFFSFREVPFEEHTVLLRGAPPKPKMDRERIT